MSTLADYLFSQGDLHATLDQQSKILSDDIERLDKNYVLNVNDEELVRYLTEKYSIEALEIDSNSLQILKEGESEVEISDYGRRIVVKRQFVNLGLAFSGDANLLRLRPNQFDSNPPRAKLANGMITWTDTLDPHVTPERTRENINSMVSSIKRYADYQRPMIGEWNRDLDNKIRSRFRLVKERLLKNASLVSALGIPLSKKEDPNGTYAVPVAKRRINFEAPKVTATKFEPQPTLTESDYQEVLRHLRHMSHTIERMPDAFQNLGEEQIRTQFLMHLNGAYEGNATGETFSYQGKTDIFLKCKDRAIFIAECKFWDGPASFPDIIDQLLGYLTWRETKTAILLFVRNLDVAQVAAQIPALVAGHKSFTRNSSQSLDMGEFRFIMKSARDESLPLILTVMVFHLPKVVARFEKALDGSNGKVKL